MASGCGELGPDEIGCVRGQTSFGHARRFQNRTSKTADKPDSFDSKRRQRPLSVAALRVWGWQRLCDARDGQGTLAARSKGRSGARSRDAWCAWDAWPGKIQARSTRTKMHPVSECTSSLTLPAPAMLAHPGPNRWPTWTSSPSRTNTNAGRSWVWIGNRAPGSHRTTCLPQPSVVARSFTKTPGANVDGLHGRCSVFTHRKAPAG